METSNKLTGETLFDLTSYVVDTHANHLAQQENETEQMTHDICGPGLERPLASYDPNTQSWKMFGDISLWEEQRSLEILPPSGIALNGVLYLQPPWVPIIDETESLSWPTPRANTAMAATITPESAWNPRRFPNLETVVGRRMWPTPTTVDTFTPKSRSNPTLGDAARQVENASGKLNPTWVEWLMGFPTGWTDLED